MKKSGWTWSWFWSVTLISLIVCSEVLLFIFISRCFWLPFFFILLYPDFLHSCSLVLVQLTVFQPLQCHSLRWFSRLFCFLDLAFLWDSNFSSLRGLRYGLHLCSPLVPRRHCQAAVVVRIIFLEVFITYLISLLVSGLFRFSTSFISPLWYILGL